MQLGWSSVRIAGSSTSCVLHVLDSSSVAEPNQFCPEPAHKLPANLYYIYHCCVYSEKLLMMDRETVRNM